MNVFSWLFSFLSIWWVWLPIVLLLLYLTYQNHRKIKHIDTLEHVLLMLEVPRSNDRDEAAAEELFASLHGMLRSKRELITEGNIQEHLSFEMVATGTQVHFYAWVPKHLQSFVESQLYAQYPHVHISAVPNDYASRKLDGKVFYSAELATTAHDALPIKTRSNFETDPLSSLTTALTKLEHADEEMWIQVLARPIDHAWQRKAGNYAKRLKSGQGVGAGSVLSFLGQSLELLWKPPQNAAGGLTQPNERDQARIAEAEKKSTKPAYRVKIRVGYVGQDEHTAKLRLQTMVGTFKQFNVLGLNGFTQKRAVGGTDGLVAYQARFFIDKGFVLNTEELATIYHLPHTNTQSAHVAWASGKTTAPPTQLPALTGEQSNDNEISAFAAANFRGLSQQFGLYRTDRDRHVYIIGQTGVGKSKLLELFALSDLYHNQGYAIIDPHGDLAIDNLYFVPPSRINDVVYFNATDSEFPVGFNPLEVTEPALKGHVSTELVGVLKPFFAKEWTPRLEYALRNAILALLDYPGATMLDLTRLVTDEPFRHAVTEKIVDPVVRAFWTGEFEEWKRLHSTEVISPILTKLGAFTSNPLVRNILGQPKSTFNLRQIMDEGKIFIVNLSRGLLGEENAAVLGSLLIARMQLAAMSRADITRSEARRPFYLYIDEFQHFATDSFVAILTEARKYGLSLTVANQYMAQMPPQVQDAIFGNVSTIISFRVGAENAEKLAKHFEPQFEAADLNSLHNRNFAISMIIKGERVPAFSGTTLALPAAQQNYIAEIIKHTRKHHARPRLEVEQLLQQRVTTSQLNQVSTSSDEPLGVDLTRHDISQHRS
jgi:hypothetical protein